MGLVYIREPEEEAVYQQSLANPMEKIPTDLTAGHLVHYLNGAKYAYSKPDGCVEKTKSETVNFDSMYDMAFKIREFEKDSQLSFGFMHPLFDRTLSKRPNAPWSTNFSEDKNMRFEFFNIAYVEEQRRLYYKRMDGDAVVESKIAHAITANVRKRKKEK